ncbi:MAG: AAA family ATPase [Nanoarchaeota archaeon]|nr:AAA family ATPase [Nanoarchaeota archaeon]
MIIGITGTHGAGKTETVQYLKELGFKHYSARAFLQEEMSRRDLPDNRDSMVLVGNDLRAKHGPSYIAQQLYVRAKAETANCVIESLRTPGEVKWLKAQEQFYLLALDANQELRYTRITERKQSSDFVSFERFVKDEEREMHSDDETKQNISACMKLANFNIENSGTLEELKTKIKEIINQISQ